MFQIMQELLYSQKHQWFVLIKQPQPIIQMHFYESARTLHWETFLLEYLKFHLLSSSFPFFIILFDFTVKNFNEKRKEFCYAGDWSGVLNLETGLLRKCYSDNGGQLIFDDISRSTVPIFPSPSVIMVFRIQFQIDQT